MFFCRFLEKLEGEENDPGEEGVLGGEHFEGDVELLDGAGVKKVESGG